MVLLLDTVMERERRLSAAVVVVLSAEKELLEGVGVVRAP